jgi:ankyrin repeat protein
MALPPLSPEDLLELLECARYGETADVAELLDAGADVDHTDAGGNTALHRAAANGHVDTVRLLAARGARWRANANGSTPLHWAAVNGHAPVVAALLEGWDAELDVLAKNAVGKSALTEAINHGHEDLARALLSHRSGDPGFHGGGGGGGAGGGTGAGATASGGGDGDGDDGGMEETEGDVADEDADLLEGGGEGGGDAGGDGGVDMLQPAPGAPAS